MEAVREGPKSTLSSGKVVALAAGLSVGATVGYIVYRQIKSPSRESRISLVLDNHLLHYGLWSGVFVLFYSSAG